MVKHWNITEDAFRFIKYRCKYCKGLMKFNKIFCSMDCQVQYFEKMNKIKYGTWTNKKIQSKHHVKLSDLLSEENLKSMVKDTEKNIDERMN